MFSLYDFSTYAGKPSVMFSGMRKGKLYWEGQFFSTADHSGPTTVAVRQAIANNALSLGLPPETPICLDIESWPVYTVAAGDTVSLSDAKIAIQKYIDTIVTIKQTAPSLQLGFFGAALPMEDGLYRVSKSRIDDDIRGAALQKMVLQRSLALVSDILFPSCYAYSTDIREWHRSFDFSMDLCDQLSHDCRVIPFLWPQYATVAPHIAGQFIPGWMWREMLEHCYERAGGAAIYGQSQTTWEYARAQEWASVTPQFISYYRLS